jgi:hypothetical protein
MKTLWLFLRPSLIKITLLIILLAISSFMATSYQPTSKVSWLESRGAPFSFMILSGYQGPCLQNTVCRGIKVSSFQLDTFVIDAVLWYLVSCAIVVAYEALRMHGEHQAAAH